MANWKYKLRISHIWNNEDMPIDEKGKAIAKVMRQVFKSSWLDELDPDFDEELDMIVHGFEDITGYDGTSPVEEFDDYMESLYDWADQEVAPFGKWPRNKMCWVETS